MKNFLIILSTIFICALALFLVPLIVMKGYNIFAWEYNLPTFNYWQSFWICWAIKTLLSNNIKIKNKKED